MEQLNVMIVNDSSVAAHMLSSILMNLGHKVVRTARTGAEAVIAYKICNPDVVIMDITMPDMDGIAATERILMACTDARIIVVSSHAEKSVVMKARTAGAKGYILKPIHSDKLRETLEYVMKIDRELLNS
jgi:two-component system, chemotaxis family, chemotaxis protein CheY